MITINSFNTRPPGGGPWQQAYVQTPQDRGDYFKLLFGILYW